MSRPPTDTRDAGYAEWLARKEGAAWKRWLGVQAPFRWNLRRLALGRTLDVGCGVGRNLAALPPGSVGVDHNPAAVALARRRGLEAFLPDALAPVHAGFDALLFAHVLEHADPAGAREMVAAWLPRLRAGGRVVLITPQEAGFRSDPSHVAFLDADALSALAAGLGLEVLLRRSFPLPRFAGAFVPWNEFLVVACRP